MLDWKINLKIFKCLQHSYVTSGAKPVWLVVHSGRYVSPVLSGVTVATGQAHNLKLGPADIQRIQALMLLNLPATLGPTEQMHYILVINWPKARKRPR